MPQDMPPKGGYEPVQYKVRRIRAQGGVQHTSIPWALFFSFCGADFQPRKAFVVWDF